ncbi:MAG TPA: TonB-dependent receptor [Terriglobia bacterium]|nr:TonB-dependent receptor [Terriglobia bacterium]
MPSRNPARLACTLIFFALLLPLTSNGQQAPVGGTVSGHVRGPGGVSVPGATVILTNKQSGERKETWTDEDGNYAFTAMSPGTYKLTISLVGFQDDLRDPVPVSADKPLKVNIALVMASPGGPNVGAAMRGSGGSPNSPSISPQALERLRNLRTQSGMGQADAMAGEINSDVGGDSSNVRFSQSAGGQAQGDSMAGGTSGGDDNSSAPDLGASASNSFLLSGGVGGQTGPGEGGPFQGGRMVFQRNGEGPGAGGFGGGGPVGLGGGGGRFAGGRGGFAGGRMGGGPMIFIGGRPFGQRSQINRIRGNIMEQLTNSAVDARSYPLNTSTSPLLSSYHEQFAVGFGGPLYIPKIYDGKDKTSFFFNYQLQRSKSAFDSYSTVPTLAERNGDFTGAPTIYEPQSGSLGPRTPFPGNQISPTLFDAAAAGLLKYLPLPNLTGTVQNFHLQQALPARSDRVMFMVNRRISDKDNANVRYFLNSSHSDAVTSFPALTRQSSTRQQNLNLAETHTFNPHAINTLMFNFNRSRTLLLNPFANQQNIGQALGIQGVSQNPFDYGLPIINLTNFTGLNDTIPSLNRPQTFRVVDFVLWNHGKHNLRTGGEVRRVQQNSLTDPDARGTFTFNGYTTSDFTAQGLPVAGTGFDFADFLLGLPQATSSRFGVASNYFRSWVLAGFVQDDWRATSRLTLNGGLRYEYFQPFTENFGHLSDLAIGPGFSSIGVVTGQSPDGLPNSLVRSDPYNFAPRMGVAYRPWTRRKVVLRAGYGIFYDSSVYSRFVGSMADQPPFATASTLLTSPAQVLTLENGFPVVKNGVLTNTYAVDPNFRTPYGQSWNFTLENEIARDLILSVGYVGTKGTSLDLLLGPNRASSSSTSAGLALRNAQQFTYETSGASSIYQGLQVILRRQFHNGLSASAYYTYSKSIDDASSVGGAGHTVAQDTFNLAAERGLSVFDIRHRLNINNMYEFPFGQRKRYLNRGGMAAKLLDDWRIFGNTTIQSGTPFTARVLGNQSASGGIGAYFSGRAQATGLPVSFPASNRSTLAFFNTSAFTLPPSDEFGNAGRNTIPGPGMINFNMSLMRIVTIAPEKGVRLNFRLEANNIFNHPNYTGIATTVDAINYGRVTSVGNMRTLSMTMRLMF